jgi:mRNA interferase RelE/StbE
MPMLTWDHGAIKELRRMPRDRARQIREIMLAIAADPPPLGRHTTNLRPLRGIAQGWRLRAGDWRVSFVVGADRIEVFEVAPRGSAYRW